MQKKTCVDFIFKNLQEDCTVQLMFLKNNIFS